MQGFGGETSGKHITWMTQASMGENIKTEMEWEDVDEIFLAQDRDKMWVLLNTTMNLKGGKFLACMTGD